MTTINANIEEILATAIGFVNAGQDDQARKLCAHAASFLPPHPAVLQLFAVIELRGGRASQARFHAAASLALRPDHIPTLIVASDAARAEGDFAAASDILERVVTLSPAHVNAWFQLALVRQDLHDLPGAVAALHEVLLREPERADAEVNLGIVLQEEGNLEEAMRAYGRAYRLREDTFGRIAHALSTPNVGRLWLNLEALRVALNECAA